MTESNLRKKEFILASRSGGMEYITAGSTAAAKHNGRSGVLRDHVSTAKVERRNWKWAEAIPSWNQPPVMILQQECHHQLGTQVPEPTGAHHLTGTQVITSLNPAISRQAASVPSLLQLIISSPLLLGGRSFWMFPTALLQETFLLP